MLLCKDLHYLVMNTLHPHQFPQKLMGVGSVRICGLRELLFHQEILSPVYLTFLFNSVLYHSILVKPTLFKGLWHKNIEMCIMCRAFPGSLSCLSHQLWLMHKQERGWWLLWNCTFPLSVCDCWSQNCRAVFDVWRASWVTVCPFITLKNHSLFCSKLIPANKRMSYSEKQAVLSIVAFAGDMLYWISVARFW